MSAGTGMGISLTTITTDLQCPLGFIHTEPAAVGGMGATEYIYISVRFSDLDAQIDAAVGAAIPAAQGGPIGAGDIRVGSVMSKPDAIANVAMPYDRVRFCDATASPASGSNVVGVSQQAWTWLDHYPNGPGAADELFGFVLRTGHGLVRHTGALIGEALIPFAPGAVPQPDVGEGTVKAVLTDVSFGNVVGVPPGANLNVQAFLHCPG